MAKGRRKRIPLYCKISRDKYQLIEAFSETVIGLADMTGDSRETLYAIFSRLRHNKAGSKRYALVIIDVDDEDD